MPEDVFESESERVTHLLRQEILDGVRAPGSKLVERDLAAIIGVSRIPVRDALRTLVSEGLVTPRPRSWAVVREFTDDDVADLNEVRIAIEPLIFRLAAQRRTRTDLARLRKALRAELKAARAGDAIDARRAAADFHEIVTEMSANELLTEFQRNMRSRMRWLMAQHDDLIIVAEEHQGLFDAIEAHDVTSMDALVQQHLGIARGRIARA